MNQNLIASLLAPPNSFCRRLGATVYHLICGSVRKLWQSVYSAARVARNVVNCLRRQSDYRRWTDINNYEQWWDSRTQKIARFIPPNSRVIEFGAGRRQLEKLLDPTCSYVPSDLTDRGPGTLVCDLNRRPFPDLSHLNVDTAVFGGVLEYLQDLESLVEWLAQHVSLCVVSYACAPPRDGMFRLLRSSFDRYYYGYMNAYEEDQLIDIFRKGGFHCVARDLWTSQRLFLFGKRRISG